MFFQPIEDEGRRFQLIINLMPHFFNRLYSGFHCFDMIGVGLYSSISLVDFVNDSNGLFVDQNKQIEN